MMLQLFYRYINDQLCHTGFSHTCPDNLAALYLFWGGLYVMM